MTRFGLRTMALAALALGVSLSGSRARADLTLSITEVGGPAISINSTTGLASLTAPVGTYIYNINGSNVTFVVPVSGTVTGVVVPTNTGELTFTANGSTNSFDSYSKLAVDITPQTGPLGALLTDINTDVTAASSSAGALSITAGNLFGLIGPGTVTSTLSASALQSGTVSFQSTVDGTMVPMTPLMLTAGQNPLFAGASASLTLTGANTFNTLVVSGLTAGLTDSITGTTGISTPEPGTLAAALTGLGLLGGYRLRRRAK